MNSVDLFFVSVYSLICIRFLIISFKIITKFKTINFSLFTPTIVTEHNKVKLLFYSLSIAITSVLAIITFIFLKSYSLGSCSLMLYFVLQCKAEKYTD